MADRFRVLALDQRGFGESQWATDYHELRLVADVAQFGDALGLGAIALVGFSIGGSAAITYAQLYPDRVRRLARTANSATTKNPFAAMSPTASSSSPAVTRRPFRRRFGGRQSSRRRCCRDGA